MSVKLLLLAGCLAVTLTGAGSATPITWCPDRFNLVYPNCFGTGEFNTSWTEANKRCKQVGGRLVELNSVTPDFLNWLENTAQEIGDEVWLGGSFTGGQWTWASDKSAVNLAALYGGTLAAAGTVFTNSTTFVGNTVRDKMILVRQGGSFYTFSTGNKTTIKDYVCQAKAMNFSCGAPPRVFRSIVLNYTSTVMNFACEPDHVLSGNKSIICTSQGNWTEAPACFVNLACQSNPCTNRSTCEPILPRGNICNCPAGFTGQTCDSEVNECLSRPCKNSGFCVDGKGSYSCICNYLFEGATCDIGRVQPNAMARKAFGFVAITFMVIIFGSISCLDVPWYTIYMKCCAKKSQPIDDAEEDDEVPRKGPKSNRAPSTASTQVVNRVYGGSRPNTTTSIGAVNFDRMSMSTSRTNSTAASRSQLVNPRRPTSATSMDDCKVEEFS